MENLQISLHEWRNALSGTVQIILKLSQNNKYPFQCTSCWIILNISVNTFYVQLNLYRSFSSKYLKEKKLSYSILGLIILNLNRF